MFSWCAGWEQGQLFNCCAINASELGYFCVYPDQNAVRPVPNYTRKWLQVKFKSLIRESYVCLNGFKVTWYIYDILRQTG